jgi:hypothetical protein
MTARTVLHRLAEAWLQRERDRLGITAGERATAAEGRTAQEAGTNDLYKRAQAQRLMQQMEHERESQPVDVDYRRSLAEQARAQADAARALAGQRDEGKPGTPHYETDAAGNVTVFTPQPDGSFQRTALGRHGTPQRPPVGRTPDPASASQNSALLLGGGTADKIPIGERAAAVAEAKASGGVDGTGFVPMNNQQQFKFTDFMDLRAKALRLRTLLANPEVVAQLGPAMGRWTGLTKELPGIGQSTIVKEAFDLFKNLSDIELRRRSGAAISPGEYSRIVGFTVDPTKQADSNLTNLYQMLATLNNALRIMGAERLRDDDGRAPIASGGGPAEFVRDPATGKLVRKR